MKDYTIAFGPRSDMLSYCVSASDSYSAFVVARAMRLTGWVVKVTDPSGNEIHSEV